MTGPDREKRRTAMLSRRRMLTGGAAIAAMPFVGPLRRASAAPGRDLLFRALWNDDDVGEHRITFRAEGDRLTVSTQIDIEVKVLFFTAFRLKHLAEEVCRAGRIESVTSTTDFDGTLLTVSGGAVAQGFRVVGKNGPFLADGHLLTSNSLWNSRIMRETRLIDVQHGGEVGLVARPLGDVRIDMPRGPVQASRYQVITPYYAGTVFYDRDRRWIKALIEYKGETIEYVPAI